jgi:hypothetical protein
MLKTKQKTCQDLYIERKQVVRKFWAIFVIKNLVKVNKRPIGEKIVQSGHPDHRLCNYIKGKHDFSVDD